MVSVYTIFCVCNFLRIYDYVTIKSCKKSSSHLKFQWHSREWNTSLYWMSFFPLLFLCFRLFLKVLEELRGFRLVILLDFQVILLLGSSLLIYLYPKQSKHKIPRIIDINITVRLANLSSCAGERCWCITGTMLYFAVPLALTTLLPRFIQHLPHIGLCCCLFQWHVPFSNWAVRSHDQRPCQHIIGTL